MYIFLPLQSQLGNEFLFASDVQGSQSRLFCFMLGSRPFIRALQCEHFSKEALLCSICSFLSISEYKLCGQKAPSQSIQTLGWIRLSASYLIIMAKIYLALVYSHEDY